MKQNHLTDYPEAKESVVWNSLTWSQLEELRKKRRYQEKRQSQLKDY